MQSRPSGLPEQAMRKTFTGVGTALVTPFMRGGKLDDAAVRRLARRQIDAGVHFLCPCGTTGENPTLSDAERLRIVEILVDEAKGQTPSLAGLPNIVGVKEASGNITQMCEICRAVPDDFIVLSGDDALTLPLMAVGGRGIISVAANEIPSEMVQMVEVAERNDFAAARTIHARILPLMQVNFVESNPVPVKAAMASMGLLEAEYRLPMTPPQPASREKINRVLKELGLLKPALV